jgi:hypothetical protein
LKRKKDRILLVKINDLIYGIHTSSIETIKEYKDCTFNQNMNSCIVKGEQDESERFPVLNFGNIEDDINKRFIDPELTRIIIVRERESNKRGVIVVDTIIDLLKDISERIERVDIDFSNSSTHKGLKIRILEITKAFMTLASE